MSVTQAIHDAIANIEAKHDVRVLFAAESGSRAWGFASPDSDYDVRFVYIHRPDWYLRITEPNDVIEAMLPGDLDLSGWDLRKTLRLFLRCNLALNEWLGSPIVYAENGSFAERMRALVPSEFRAPAGYHHYLGMAHRVFGDHLAHDPVRLKKVFYVLRPLLACRWIAACGTQPPTEFAQLVEADWVNADERSMIEQLLIAKSDVSEGHMAPLDTSVRSWLDRELIMAKEQSASILSNATLQSTTLDQLLRDLLRTSWT